MINLAGLTGMATDASYDLTAAQAAIMGSVLTGFFAVIMILALAGYIYSALTMMAVAKRTKTKKGWLAWIPVANMYLMAKIAKQSAWPLWLLLAWIPCLTFFISPILGIIFMIIAGIASVIVMVFMYIWQWKICEVRGKPGWWAILPLIAAGLSWIPILGAVLSIAGSVWSLVMWGILAWGK